MEKEEIVIENAGLVLTAVFLPEFLSRLGCMSFEEEENRVSSERVTSKIVSLTQYLVEFRLPDDDSNLALNKVLCGVAPATKVRPPSEINDRDEEISLQVGGGFVPGG